jgi:type IV pilus assembly protein PilC
MPIKTFYWQGLNPNGESVEGVCEAKNITACKIALYKQNIFPKYIKSNHKNWHLFHNQRITHKNINDFIYQIATLLAANISLIQALVISQETKNLQLRNLITSIVQSVKAGSTLSNALQKHPNFFPKLVIHLILVGEETGNLDKMLAEICNYNEKLFQFKRKLIKTFWYPLVVFCLTIIITIILLVFVVPQLQTMFANFGAALPAYTQFIINSVNFLKTFGLYFLAIILIAQTIARYIIKRSPAKQQKVERLILQLPIIGALIQKILICLILKTLTIGLKSGIPLLSAVNLCTEMTSYTHYRQALNNIANCLTHGKSLNIAMRQQKIFSETILQLVALGEETGNLDTMLERCATIYTNKINYIIDNLNQLLEPLIMIFLGIIIGGLIIGMYLPIFQLGKVI